METGINIFEDEAGKFYLGLIVTDDKTFALSEELELQGGGYTAVSNRLSLLLGEID